LKLDFATKRVVTWPVTVHEPVDGGAVRKHRFHVDYEILGTKEQNAVIDAGEGGSDQALLRRTVQGWKGVTTEGGAEFPYTADNLETLLDIGFVRSALIQGYLQAAAGAKAKN